MAKTAKMRRKRAKKKQSAIQMRDRVRHGRSFERLARSPVIEVLVSRDWAKHGELVQVLVARGKPGGPVAVGVFLVDLGCLGVKSAFSAVLSGEFSYRSGIRWSVTDVQPMMPADLDLAAKIVREGVGYARSLGFEPDPDHERAASVLHGSDPDACRASVPLGGEDGNPYYFAGPDDDSQAILRKLAERFGWDGFHFTVPMG